MRLILLLSALALVFSVPAQSKNIRFFGGIDPSGNLVLYEDVNGDGTPDRQQIIVLDGQLFRVAMDDATAYVPAPSRLLDSDPLVTGSIGKAVAGKSDLRLTMSNWDEKRDREAQPVPPLRPWFPN